MKKHFLSLAVASLCISMAADAQQTTATQSRLIATARYVFNSGALGLQDSNHLSYSPNRGYEYELDRWKFDNLLVWAKSGSSLEQKYRQTQTFDGQNHIASNLLESGPSWSPTHFERYTYTGAARLSVNVIANLSSSSWDSSRYTYTYNGSNALTERLYETWTGGGWRNSFKIVYVVDAAGLVVTEYNLTWNTGTNSWDTTSRTSYTYNSNGKPVEAIYASFSTGSWQDVTRSVSTYDGNGNEVSTENFKWNTSGSVWEKSYKYDKTYDGNHNVLTNTTMVFTGGAYENRVQNAYRYNGYNQVTYESYKGWNAGTSSYEFRNGDYETNYYYEQFNNAVKEVANGNRLAAYPVPAAAFMNIRFGGNSQTAYIYLLDNTGKTVKQVMLPSGSTVATMDIRGLPSGNYHLKAISGTQAATQQVTIVQ